MEQYFRGYNTALSELGLEKIAIVSPMLKAPLMRRLSWSLKNRLPTKSGIRNFFVGDPRRFGQELLSGNALGKGSLIRDSFKAPGVLQKALLYGVPAAEIGGIALDSEANKGERIGNSLGGAALGLAAFRPLGLLGSMGAYELGSRAGGLLGGTAEHLGRSVTRQNTEI